jgi:hypothetical protein
VVAPCAAPQLEGSGALRVAASSDENALTQAVSNLLERAPQREDVRATVRSMTWEASTAALLACYRELAGVEAR